MRHRLRDPVTGLLFVLPVLVLFLIFRIFPTLGAAGMSLTNWNIGGEWDVVGADNYVRLWNDPNFWASLRVTLVYAAIFVPLTVLVSLGTALLLNAVIFMRGLFRSMLFLPYVTSFVFAGIIWRWIYEFDGLLNGLLTKVDLGPVQVLESSRWCCPRWRSSPAGRGSATRC
ncbi:sugar ABC transporter permease [Nonomuraea dietziae]|uniref:carbohydrate ABC transporter permease n=1 Tax=Nonomuraea dietziae TaxID=65515 RepID=UPI0031D9D322